MDIEKEIEALKKRVKLLEEWRDLRNKVEELEKQIAQPVIPYIPYYPVYPQPWNPNPYPWYYDGHTITTGGETIVTFTS